MSGFSAFIVAGTNSGVGKTSISLALCALLARRGVAVQPFKCGPDFLDPTWLSIAAGRSCYNLDGWMMGREYATALFAHGSQDAAVSVIEGVMGLFDGASPDSLEGSAAEIALLTKAPMLLVVDARGMAGSIAAMVHGYANFAEGVKIAGVIANNVGSDRHGDILARALDAAHLPPLLGAVPKNGFPALPSRHLGLTTANKELLSGDVLRQLAGAAEKYLAVDRILALTQIPRPATDAMRTSTAIIARIGIAHDEAFHFYYRDNLECLERHGAQLIRFSPLYDAALPDDLDALYIGGGYPEEYAGQLSANVPMLQSMRSFADGGRPVYAECGGLIYLSRGVQTRDGVRHSLAGLLPFWTRMRDRYRNLGYAEASFLETCPLGGVGGSLRGHRFHYSEIEPFGEPEGWRPLYALAPRNGQTAGQDGFMKGNIMASYVHAHFASRPPIVERFVQHSQQHRNNN